MKRVLLVDDDPNLLEGLLRFFRGIKDEWLVSTAGNGAEALACLSEHRVDLIVTDILMPGTDGIEVIIEVRRRYPDIKVIAMSGGGRHVGADVLNSARMLGAAAVIEKPFPAGALVDQMRLLLSEETSAAG